MRRRLFPLYAAQRSVALPVDPPENTAAPVLSAAGGNNAVGIVWSCTTGLWDGSPTSFSYDWLADGVSIGAPNASTYTPVAGDVGAEITCEVTATNGAGSSTPEESNGITVKPYWSAVPTYSGTMTVGSTLTGAGGTVAGATPTYEWIVGGTGTGTSTPYTILAADAGDAIVYRGTATNAGGTSTSDSASATVKPYLSVAPVVSGTNAVGGTLTSTAPTWLGATSTAAEWVVGGSGTGDTDTSYGVTSGEEGLVVTYDVSATNAGGTTGPTSSNAVTIKPHWEENPYLDSPIENWPGGTVTAVQGTVLGETSGPTGEWLIDGSGTLDTDTSYTPIGSDVSKDLLYRESASNAGGASTADSDSIEIVQIEGVQRAGEADDWLTNSTTGIPANCTILVEVIGISASSNGSVVSIGRQPGASSTRREMGVLISSTGTTLSGIYRDGMSLGIIALSGLPDMLDGTTRHIIAVDQASGSSAARVTHIVPFGTVTSATTFTTGSYANPSNGGITDQAPSIFRRGAALVSGGIAVTEFAGIVNVAVLNRRLGTTDYDDIADAGSLEAWGAFSDADLRWSLRPDPATAEGDALTNAGTQLDGATYTIQAGTSDCTLGGLNEAV